MRLEDARQIYYDRSGIASDVSRKLAFAGIAIIWIFSGGTPTNVQQVHISHDLRWEAILFTTALTADLLQYMSGSLLWGIFSRLKEKDLKTVQESEFEAPRAINWPALAFFWAKLISLSIGYGLALDFLARRLQV